MAVEHELRDNYGKMTPKRAKMLMVLVAIITAIAIWLVPVDKKQEPQSLPPLSSAPGRSVELPMPMPAAETTEEGLQRSTAPDEPVELPMPSSAPGTSMELPLPSAPGSPEVLPLASAPAGGIAEVIQGGERARDFISELRSDDGAELDVDAVFAEAERQQGEGNREDAYLLYRFAARHGQAQAALTLGSQADPAYHTAATSYLPEPEPDQAYKWYSEAAAAGNEEAVARLQDLRARVQREAAAGDEPARRLMLQWR